MTQDTLQKAHRHIKEGNIDRTGPGMYRVTSADSGQEYAVWLAERDVCTCPATVRCSHIAAATIVRAKRRAARTATA